MLGGDYSVPLTVVSDSMDHDNILYFHNNCQWWINEVKQNKSATEEAEKFLSAHIQEVGSHISAKTGIPAEALTNDVLSVIWGTCQSDVDVFDDTSMWCSLFSERDAAIMEYHDDLEAYYSKGYAYPLNHRMAALLFQDIVSSLEASKACSGGGGGASKNTLCVRSNLRFAHAETLIPFLVGLGLYKDKKAPTAEWTEAEIAARQWRLEDMVPMLGSAVLLQYSCEDDETYLDFYHNEMVTPIPGCNNTGKNVDPRLCPLSRFKEIVKDYLAIDWHQICDLEEK